ncbi:hypothetical protein CYMTET_25482 [Cymbomonas tetramitiformis]|uniref:Uncharacterized protein n=1 Tax=Cymbomonas tetramitiformis TaxID=36881 RepID=A0AAE0KZ50_9CHLO|nr:hypothetical protein CYMTET_25482 [Cymbomonas tetramitiformis]
MRGAVQNGVNTKSLLTPVEEEEVVTWLEGCTDGHKARNRRETGSKICEVLTNRDRRNKASKGRKYQKLSRAAIHCLANGGPNPSWFQAFFEKYKHRVNEKKAVTVEKARVMAATEETVQEHFYAPAGLEAAMAGAGIMDPVTKKILDPRRVLNRDETPQFISFDTQKGNNVKKVAGRKGKSAADAKKENRECFTVDMVMGLDGFLYGLHVLVARASLTKGLTPEILEDTFTNEIREGEKVSTYGIVTVNECGVQNEHSLNARYKVLINELEHRGVPFPVVELTDNHASRYSEMVMITAEGGGIRQFSEKPNSSGFLQALDQINRKFHVEFAKGERELKHARRAEFQALAHRTDPDRVVDISEVKLNMTDAFTIISMIWFCWCTVMDRITAFRKVGITQAMCDPSLVNRSSFVFSPPAPPPKLVTPPLVEELPSPEVRKGSLEYYKLKYYDARNLANEWQTFETTPFQQGLLEPMVMPAPPPKPDRGRLEEQPGSFLINGIRAKKRERRENDEAVQEQRQRDRDLAERLKAEREEAARAAQQQAVDGRAKLEARLWEKCTPVCTCACRGVILFVAGERVHCPIKGFKKCPFCLEIKKSICGKKECKAKRAAGGAAS